jgi:urease accessory protein
MKPLMTIQPSSKQQQNLTPLLFVPLLLVLFALPAAAHHPLGMAEGAPITPLFGLLSGLGHPLLGIDHLLFLVSIAFIGLTSLRRWLVPLLAVGLAGSLFAQSLHLAVLPGGMEVIVALSLVASGLVSLGLMPPPMLVPMMFLHGVVLGSQIVGSEPTPILLYFIGLFISQSLLLLGSCWLARLLQATLTAQAKAFLAFAWIGIGLALAWSAASAA